MTAHSSRAPWGRGVAGRWRLVVVELGVVLAVAWWAAGAAATSRQGTQAPAGESAPRVTLRLLAQATAAGGPTGVPRAVVTEQMPAGATLTATFVAGTRADPDLCALRTVQGDDPEDAFLAWRVSAIVKEIHDDVVRISLEWKRDGLQPIDGRSGARDLRLRRGQSHVFDVVMAPRTQAGGCTNVVLSVEIADSRPAAETGALLGYQMTLVHERGGTRAAPLPVNLVGTPGESVAFRFRPLEWAVAMRKERGEAPRISMDVLGQVSGRVRDDGKIDVSLTAVRRLTFGGATAGSGTRQFVAAPGEETVVEIPRPSTTSWKPLPDARMLGPLLPGVEVERDGLRVRYASFFAGDRTSIVIRVDRIR